MEHTKPTILDSIDEPSVTDPLSEVTRRERKALLSACVVGLAISAGGLVPERIETFGIIVTTEQEESLLFILSGVIAYFLIAFTVYSWADLKRRQTVAARHRQRLQPVIKEATDAFRETQELLQNPKTLDDALQTRAFLEVAGLSDQAKFAKRVQRAGMLRIAVDIYFPLVAGIVSVFVVWSSTQEFPGWRNVGLGTIFASLISGLAVLWWRRRDIRQWWRKARRSHRSKQLKKLTDQIKSLPPDHRERVRLQAKARKLVDQTLDDFKKGI